jgi:ribonuclease P protein component
MGLIVPKFHHSAVARNRLRRRLKEIWRIDVQHYQGSCDLLIRARPEAYQAPFVTLKEELLHWRDAVRTVE